MTPLLKLLSRMPAAHSLLHGAGGPGRMAAHMHRARSARGAGAGIPHLAASTRIAAAAAFGARTPLLCPQRSISTSTATCTTVAAAAKATKTAHAAEPAAADAYDAEQIQVRTDRECIYLCPAPNAALFAHIQSYFAAVYCSEMSALNAVRALLQHPCITRMLYTRCCQQ